MIATTTTSTSTITTNNNNIATTHLTKNQKPDQQQLINANSITSISSAHKKPLDMNTYVQLEIDNSSSICVPRLCKFNINKLTLNKTYLETHVSAILIAIKLNASKRYLRTTEILLQKTTATLNSNEISINLNLNYSITYPHYLKKSTNYLEFFIQRRKKYKNRPILGYKTLAYGSINLENVIQKSFVTSNLMLELRQQQNQNNSSKLHALQAGVLSIGALTSSAIDLTEIEANTHHPHEFDDFDLIDVVHSCHIASDNEKAKKRAQQQQQRQRSQQQRQQQQQPQSSSQQPKNLTGKLISFLRKLKNDSLLIDDERSRKKSLPLIKHGPNDNQDDDLDEFEQLSDLLSDSDCLEECDNDLYSIISTPKPSLQPFFSQQTNKNSYQTSQSLSASNDESNYYFIYNSIDGGYDKNIEEFLNWTSINVNLNKKSSETQFKHDLKGIFDGVSEKSPIFLVLMLNERFFNKFLRFFISISNETHTKFVKIVYIPFFYDVNEQGVRIHNQMRTSLAYHLSKYDNYYSSLYCENYWSNFDSCQLSLESIKRLKTYVCSHATNLTQLPIYTCAINSDDQVPFINHILLGGLLGYTSSSNDEDDDNEDLTMQLHRSLDKNQQDTSFQDVSPPQSPATHFLDEEFDVQIDYWTSSMPLNGSLNHSTSQKLNKTTLKASVRSVSIYSTNEVRLGKKIKDSSNDQQRKEVIENIMKIECSLKHNAACKILVDGLQYTNVKQIQINLTTNSNLRLLNLMSCTQNSNNNNNNNDEQ